MVKRLLSALCLALALINPAFAQSFPKPPDVPAYIPRAATYQPATGSVPNGFGDGSDTRGGVPPIFTNGELADIPTPNTTGWTNVNTGTPWGDAYGYCSVPNGTFNGHGCPEPKFRTHILHAKVQFDDPIRNYSQPGRSHCHDFFGNEGVNAYSTYASLREHPSSTAAGGILNATAYWFPCVTKTVGGVKYAVHPDYMIVYYNAENATTSTTMQRIPRGLRFIMGTEMDDFDDSLAKKEIYDGNHNGGSGQRYTYFNNGIVGWNCYALNGAFVRYLADYDGSDPWLEKFGQTCPAGTQIAMTVDGPDCWDGWNLWSPGGYKHMRYEVQDGALGSGGMTCPNGWYRLPHIQIQFVFTQNGAADYTTWRLSSDDYVQSLLNALPACILPSYSNAPCNETGVARTIRNGESFHTDWFGAWDYPTMLTWMHNCLGLEGFAPHQCEPSIISSTQSLIYGAAPDGRNPQIDDTKTYGTTDLSKMIRIGTVHNGPMTMHNHT